MGYVYMYVSVFIAQISVLIAASSITWSSPMLVKLSGTDDNPLGYVISDGENSFLASAVTLGAIIGSIIFGILVTKFGRKTLLTMLGIPFLVCYTIMIFSKVIWIFYFCRIVAGIGLGGVFTILPMYCGEIADAGNRGILSASMTVFINIGMLIPYSIGPFISFVWFHIISAIIPAVFMVLFFCFAPESPYYLIKENEAAAEAVLLKIRSKETVPRIIEEMKENLKDTAESSIMDIIRSRAARRTFIIGLGGFTFQQLTGTSIVATYSQTIFEEAGGDISADVCPIIVGVTQLIMTVLVSSITDKFPRKFLLTLSHLLVGLILIPFGTYFFLQKHSYDVSTLSWMPLTCLLIYVCVYNIGAGPILLVFIGELFPPKIKGLAVSWMISYSWMCSFLTTSLFNPLKELIGIGVLFWVFSGCSFAAIIFIRLFMVETKGKTLEQIQRELK